MRKPRKRSWRRKRTGSMWEEMEIKEMLRDAEVIDLLKTFR
jgi:hypothetical protein